MEERLPDISSDSPRSAALTQAVERQRGRVQQFVAAHREQLDRIEAELSRQIERVAAELRDDRHRTEGQQREVESRAAELRREASELARLKQELDQTRAEWQRAQAEAAKQQSALVAQVEAQREECEQRATELASTEAQLRRDQRQLDVLTEEHRADHDELVRARKRLEDKSNQLETEREEIEELRSETKLQRRRIAREFQERRAALLEELQSRRQELEALAASGSQQRDQALVAAQQASRDLQQRLDEQEARLTARDEELATVSEQLEETQRTASELQQRCEALAHDAEDAVSGEAMEQLQSRCDQLDRQAADERQRAEECERQIEQLRAELAAAEKRLSEAPASKAGEGQVADLQRRQEMLLADLRELKSENEGLKRELATAKQSPQAPVADGDAMDWESRKRRLLAALEAESEDDDPERKQERLTIEATIRATEEMVSGKEREIAELKQLLDQQSSQVGGLAVGAAAIAAELDKDEIVRMEREKLQKMQEEWQQKLCQAEIDLSLERAKIARERAELEEKLLCQAQEQSRRGESGAAGPANTDPKKPPRGRWLSRLGLMDDDEAT